MNNSFKDLLKGSGKDISEFKSFADYLNKSQNGHEFSSN